MGIEKKVESLIRPEVRALKAYHVPDASGLVKLDAMENPYPWPENVRREWAQVVQSVALNRYPDPEAGALRSRLRQALVVPSGMDILLGNGSDELIQLILIAVSKPGAVVLAPTPTFVMYEQIATSLGIKFVGVPLKENFSLDMPAMLEAIKTRQPATIFMANPNNPTGNLFAREDVERLIETTAGIFVLDEAYHAFSGVSFMDRLSKFDNLLVMRTLSKQGLAGLRLGLLAGSPAWLNELNKVRLPYNVGSLTQASAEFALTKLAMFDKQAQQICADREKLFQMMIRLRGVQAWPSRTNFILFRIEQRDVTQIHDGLRKNGVLIKNLNSTDGALKGCLRVTVGTPEENAAFLKALETLL